MKEDDVINIVKELFEKTLLATSEDPYCGAEIEGKEEFFIKLKLKLKELFDNNDQSKQ